MPNEAIDFSIDDRVELHLFWDSHDNRVDVSVYFDQLAITQRVKLDSSSTVTDLRTGDKITTYNFVIVSYTTPGGFLYFEDEIFDRPHNVVAKISTNTASRAETAAL